MNNYFSLFFHLFFNSILLFLIFSFLIEILLFVLKIKNPRIRTFFRLITIFKIPFDIFIIKILHLNFFYNLNPFSCEQYVYQFLTQKLSLSFLNSSIINQITLIGFILISSILILRKSIQFLYSLIFVNKIKTTILPCDRKINNEKLKIKLKKLNAKVFLSTNIEIPFVTCSSFIILPSKLSKELSQKEFEAILSHELEHLKWKDPHLKILCNVLSTLFWWIPLKRLLNKLENDQEEACDQAIYQYEIQSDSLASAIIKVVKKTKNIMPIKMVVCSIANKKKIAILRLEKILDTANDIANQKFFTKNHLFLLVCTLLAFFSCWMC